jgi:glycosyltransferase involved in cell wall biosynthesis
MPTDAARRTSKALPPRISVIVPVHNGEAYLGEALRSAQSQDVGQLEIIVIDDGSTDDTPRVVQQSGGGCVYQRQERAGPAAARNHGLAVARGTIVGFLDADDLWPREKLATQLRFLDAHPHADAVLGMVQWLRRPAVGEEFQPVGRPTAGFQLGCGLFRRTVFDRVGVFDATLRYSEDVDWLLRARETAVEIAALEEVGLLYRHHESSMTHGKPAPSLDLLRVLKSSLDRRRRAPGLGAFLSPVRRQPGPGR